MTSKTSSKVPSKRPTWIIPALLGGVVTALVLSTYRTPASAATSASTPSSTPKRPTSGSNAPGAPPSAPPAPPLLEPSTPKPPPVVITALPSATFDVYRSLMGAMQTDIRSVDPALLEDISRNLAALGDTRNALHAAQRAACARDARVNPDPSFFPVSCGAPGLVSSPTTPAVSALLHDYAIAMQQALYERDIPIGERGITVEQLNSIVRALDAADLKTEAATLFARRDPLYKQKLDNVLKYVATAQSSGLDSASLDTTALRNAGYPAFADTLDRAIQDRKAVLLSRTHACRVHCDVRSLPDPTSSQSEDLPGQTLVTAPDPPQGEWSLVYYDAGPNGTTHGWVRTLGLTPLARP